MAINSGGLRAGPPHSRGTVDWTQGSIPLNLLKLSWPMIVGNTLNMLGPTIDIIWVGKLGSAAVAGVGVAGIAVQVVMSSMMGMVTGMRAMISRFIGAGDERAANHIATQSIIVSVFFAVFMAVAGYFLAEPILVAMKLGDDVVREGSAYLRIVFVSTIPMSLRFMGEGCMQAAGDTMRPMIITAIYRVIHLIFCPFLVLGLWIFPKLGVTGAAWMNLISQSIGAVILFWVLLKGRGRLRLTLRGLRIDLKTIWRMIRIGIPASVMGVQMSLGAFILIRLISPFGTIAVAAHTIWQRIDMLLMMTVMGLGMGAGVLAGQNLGAGKPDRASKSGWIAALIGTAFMLVLAVVILVWAENLVRIFNSEPAMVKIGADFLRIAASYYVIFAFSPVLQFCISGAGDTIPPMVMSLIGTWVIQLPLAFLLSKTSLGIYGIRWAMAITAVVGTTGFVLYYMSGRWKRKMI